MTEQELPNYLAHVIPEYAHDKVRAGNWTEDQALELSRQEIQRLLPDGVSTKDNYLFSIELVEGEAQAVAKVGVIWFAVVEWQQRRFAYIYDLVIDEARRRKGYAEQAMLALEDKVKALGLNTIALQVFGFNHAAQALYKKVGYEITNIHMAKSLGE
jgi:ribosomal protein S18 acetylase RimI-like enzyme